MFIKHVFQININCTGKVLMYNNGKNKALEITTEDNDFT